MKDVNKAITGKKDMKKIQALNRIRTHDLCVTGAMLFTNWGIRAVVSGFGPLCSVNVILGSII